MEDSKHFKTETQKLKSNKAVSQVAKAVIKAIRTGTRSSGLGFVSLEEEGEFEPKKNKKSMHINLVMRETELEKALETEYNSMNKEEKRLFRKGVSELGYIVRKAENSFKSIFRHCDNMHATVQSLMKKARRYGYRV